MFKKCSRRITILCIIHISTVDYACFPVWFPECSKIMKSLTMTSIISRRYFHFLTFLAVVFLLFIATQNFYRIDTLKASGTAAGLIGESVYGCDDIPLWQSQLLHRASLPPIAGQRNGKEKKFLAIGISTVYREENYLHTTLESLVNESDVEERKDVVVVIYLADTNTEKKERQLRSIRKHFQPQLDSGFFQVIESGPEVYPPMDFALTKRTFNDTVDRVLWRAKQVIDFAYVFSYAKTLSTFYLVIEDDIISSTQYITAVKDFIKSRGSHRWVALHFSGFLGIGLLFHNSDLPNLIRLLIMFHQEQPVDMLMRQFIALQVPDEVVARRIPSIFQHIGWKSTLPNKVQKLKDNTFDMAKRRFKNHNPPADLITTMKVYNDFVPEYAYRPAPGIFWGISKAQDTFDIIFPKPMSISRVVILSGIPSMKKNQKTMKDFVSDGTLEASSSFQKVAPNNSAICDNFTTIAEFKSGDLDVWRDKNDEHSYNTKLTSVQCLRVKVGANQKSWIILREIQVF